MAGERKSRLDGRDTEALDALLRSRGWQLVEERLVHELEVRQKDLERQSELVDTATNRGRIEMIRLAIRLPKQLKTESTKGRPASDD